MPTGWGWRVAVIATILILFGNAAGFAAGPNVVTVSWATMAQTAGTLLIVIVAFRWCELTWAEAGIGRTNLLRSTLIGAGIGLGLAAVALLALELGALLGTPITYQPFHGAATSAVLTHALVGLPLLTAIPEELAFRGLVLGLLIRKLTPWRTGCSTQRSSPGSLSCRRADVLCGAHDLPHPGPVPARFAPARGRPLGF